VLVGFAIGIYYNARSYKRQIVRFNYCVYVDIGMTKAPIFYNYM